MPLYIHNIQDIHLVFWILIRANCIKEEPGSREQWRSFFFLSAVCVITADVCGSVRAQAKEEGEKCRQLNGMCKQESFHDSQPPYVLQSVGTTRLGTVLVVFRYSFPLAAFSPPCIDRRDRKWRCGKFSSSLQTHGNI